MGSGAVPESQSPLFYFALPLRGLPIRPQPSVGGGKCLTQAGEVHRNECHDKIGIQGEPRTTIGDGGQSADRAIRNAARSNGSVMRLSSCIAGDKDPAGPPLDLGFGDCGILPTKPGRFDFPSGPVEGSRDLETSAGSHLTDEGGLQGFGFGHEARWEKRRAGQPTG